MCQLFRKQFE